MSEELKQTEDNKEIVASQENENVVQETTETENPAESKEPTEGTDEKVVEEIETEAENVSENKNETSHTEKDPSVPVVPDNFKPELKPTEMPKPQNMRFSVSENERVYYEEIIKKQKVTIGKLRQQCFELISEIETLKHQKNDTPAEK